MLSIFAIAAALSPPNVNADGSLKLAPSVALLAAAPGAGEGVAGGLLDVVVETGAGAAGGAAGV